MPSGTGNAQGAKWSVSRLREVIRVHLRSTAHDLRAISFSRDIFPFNQEYTSRLLGEFTFWMIAVVGIIPLLISTINGVELQLTLFALFFALVWGLVLKKYVISDDRNWKLPLSALLFTGIVGIPILLFIYGRFMPSLYLKMPDHENAVVSLLGFVLQVGVCEEILKLVPLLFVVRVFKWEISPLQMLTIGVFSGLGFAAFENLNYGDIMVNNAYALTRKYGTEGLVVGVENAVINSLLRAISLVLCHAIFSGIAAYFVAMGKLNQSGLTAYILTGILVSATLHGLYDWFAGIQMTIAALIIAFSFALFYIYTRKIRTLSVPAAGVEVP